MAIIRNIHAEDLDRTGLSVEAVQQTAVKNLRRRLAAGDGIQIQAFSTENGWGHAVWMGHWLTASCIVLPELPQWAAAQLDAAEVLVSVPQRQLMFLFSVGDRSFREHMTSCIAKVVQGMNKQITSDLYLLSDRGLEPFVD